MYCKWHWSHLQKLCYSMCQSKSVSGCDPLAPDLQKEAVWDYKESMFRVLPPCPPLLLY